MNKRKNNILSSILDAIFEIFAISYGIFILKADSLYNEQTLLFIIARIIMYIILIGLIVKLAKDIYNIVIYTINKFIK